MAVSNTFYRIVKKAAIIRIERGEEIDAIIVSYPKLSEEQAAQLKQELIDEGVIAA